MFSNDIKQSYPLSDNLKIQFTFFPRNSSVRSRVYQLSEHFILVNLYGEYWARFIEPDTNLPHLTLLFR